MLLLHYKELSDSYPTRREARAAQSAAARDLLQEIAKKLGFANATIAKTCRGRPYYKELPTVDFSLAHTSSLAVCALWQKKAGEAPRIGVDVEKLTAYSDGRISDFALRFFGIHECRYVLSAKDRQTAFTRVFVRKEAFAKYCGDGLGAHLSCADTLSPDFEAANGVQFRTFREGEHFIALCLPLTCAEALKRFHTTENEKGSLKSC